MKHDEHRRSMLASNTIPTGQDVTRREYEKLEDEKRILQNQFNLLAGFVFGVFVGVVWEVLRRR